MIDTLLWVFGPTLAEKVISGWNEPEAEEDSFAADVHAALLELATQLQKKDAEINAIKKELRSPAPKNLKLQLTAIDSQLRTLKTSLEGHIATENDLRDAIARRQQLWNIGLAAAVALTFAVALYCALG